MKTLELTDKEKEVLIELIYYIQDAGSEDEEYPLELDDIINKLEKL